MNGAPASISSSDRQVTEEPSAAAALRPVAADVVDLVPVDAPIVCSVTGGSHGHMGVHQ